MTRNRAALAWRVLSGLRWRLTISYAVVTLVAAGTLSIVSAAERASRGAIAEGDATGLLQKSAAGAALYLGDSSPDPDALRYWVAIPVLDDLSRSFRGRVLAVAVLDAQGRMLVAESCTRERLSAASTAGCRSSAETIVSTLLADPGGGSLRRAAQTAGTVSGTVSGRGFIAAPVPSLKGAASGTLAAVFEGGVPATTQPDRAGDLLAGWEAAWAQTWNPLVLLALVLGTATGLILSYQLVRRLHAIGRTVRIWSRGDLGPSVAIYRRDEVGDLAADLNDMAEQIRSLLATRRELARQEERSRVQRELHDAVKQELFAASLHLAAARRSLGPDESTGERHLADAQRSALRAQRELTAIIDELRPPALSTGSLEAAIAELIVAFEHETGIGVESQLQASTAIHGRVEEVVFRVVQEGLTNVRRHARASQVAISLGIEAGQARLVVSDDGRGFAGKTPRTGGLGLAGMRERVEGAGGKFEISGHAGTSIEVVLPLGEPDA